jgi:hypothetical protein
MMAGPNEDRRRYTRVLICAFKLGSRLVCPRREPPKRWPRSSASSTRFHWQADGDPVPPLLPTARHSRLRPGNRCWLIRMPSMAATVLMFYSHTTGTLLSTPRSFDPRFMMRHMSCRPISYDALTPVRLGTLLKILAMLEQKIAAFVAATRYPSVRKLCFESPSVESERRFHRHEASV